LITPRQDYNPFSPRDKGATPLQRKTTDQHIQEAIEAGSRNQSTLQLVHNWCRHAGIQKFGVGLVEEFTALPAGALGLACEHAAAAGIFAPDLADAAIDFHDRNCAQCTHRIPVGFPNIGTLVAERDARRQRAEAEQRAQRTELLARRQKREAGRQQLRAQLPSLSQSIVDDLTELDQDAAHEDVAKRLIETAKLAPETFTPELTAHLFWQLETAESWFADCGLRVLLQLNVDRKRLADCAMRCLRTHCAVASAAYVVELYAALIEPTEISDVLLALADLANPERLPLAPRPETRPGPLRALHKAHAAAVEAALEAFLSGRDPYHVSLVAGALETLSRTDKDILRRFTRSLAAKLNGAEHFIDERQTGYAGDDECIGRLKNALALALRYAPDHADTLLGNFLAGASAKSEVRLYEVYTLTLNGGRRRSRRNTSVHPAAPVALRRLLSGLKSKSPEVLREIQSALTYNADEHVSLARQEFNTLLGQAAVLDDVLKQFDAETPQQQTFLDQLERRNQRGLWEGLQHRLLEWAATAAHGSAAHTAQYVEVLDNLPKDRTELRSAFITHAKHFLGTPEGLNAMLPTLYTAMVGTCVLSRGATAELLGALNQRGLEDLPELVHEAFVALLADPYVFVHRAAISALRNLKPLREDIDRRAKAALGCWIMFYAANPKDDSDLFLVDWIRLYWHRYARPTDKGFLGAFYIQALERMRPYQAISKLRGLRHELADVDAFATLTIRLLSEAQLPEHQARDILDTLATVSPQMIQRHRTRLVEVASSERASLLVIKRVVEILTHASAWQEAALIAETVHARIPKTTQRHPLKLQANLWRLATKFEEMLSEGNLDEVAELAAQWRATEIEIKADRVKHAHQRSLIPGFPLPH
jgi:hypothetical protein